MIGFIEYFVVAAVLLTIGTFLFELATKNKEFDLIFNKGNKTAALVLGGKVFGLGIVLESSLRNSVGLVDLIIWGFAGIIAQILVYIIIDLLTPKVKFYDAVEEDKISVGVFLLFISLSIGLLISGALTY